MGREIRHVPADWEHPKRDDGMFQPLNDECYEDACQEWYKGCIDGGGKDGGEGGNKYWYHEYHGNPPNEKFYRKRRWTKKEATHIQMYETVSEGTPVSPVFATKAELINYLCEHGDFWDQRRRRENNRLHSMPCEPWTRENAEHFVNSEWVPSGIITQGKIYSPSEQGSVPGKG